MTATREMTDSNGLFKASTFRNPKRGSENRRGRSGWYDYYAGFSPTFVADALAFSGCEPELSTLLDPWNGSGTTTEVGSRSGFKSAGYDLNPAMIVVAKAKTLQPNVSPSIRALLEEILLRANSANQTPDNDPLTSWLTPTSTATFRSIDWAIQAILVDKARSPSSIGFPPINHLSALAAFFYVALFRVLRNVLRPFQSSNPTWIKSAVAPQERVNIPKSRVDSYLRGEAIRMAADLADEAVWIRERVPPPAKIGCASSLSLPIRNESIDVVVTSPPYCTRIDYVIKTAPELALLRLGNEDTLRKLREQMIGTPTISGETPESLDEWGPTCNALLRRVSSHASRASKSYYLKTQLQYFNGLYNSLLEINRTLKSPSQCFFVVQDSYYKELHIDLARILEEMGTCLGWSCRLRQDFPSTRTMVGVNAGARVYHNPRLAVESVLHFRKQF